MEVRRIDSQHFTIKLNNSDASRLIHYARVAKVGVTEFILVALLMHFVSYQRCPDYEPDMSAIGDGDDSN